MDGDTCTSSRRSRKRWDIPSPIGLLAWIYEKLVTWTDDYQWGDDEVLTWVSIYWFSHAGPTAAICIYHEVGTAGGFLAPPRLAIPMGVSYFPKEICPVPRTWLRIIGNTSLWPRILKAAISPHMRGRMN
ncbi:hypothetical protein HETIRDRAFT_146198 [Heterobasidion irregulare TC 32-1]|uniref:Epoxide hydrolase N-terminal domain-containing protein n=1 Tax=Heterobasidion irregulare (strain TC 32-1) TaxID=747525 RepID=W4K9K6_HETIT|nr:uncharacterized protein HETIRDRAFT_146198 [Heterobasidion irregulare TC 32-1]ETW82035.1 hypothetical protein HETIRDRAFT_146198 [Heterobasidion irregulare TC 32-1]